MAKRVTAAGPVEGPWALPNGWRWERLGTVAQVIAGQSPPSAQVNRDGEGLPFFQGKAEFGAERPVARNWCPSPTKIAETNDVLISVRAPVGPTNYAPERCGIGRGLAAIRAHALSPRYVRYWLLATARILREKATGTTFEAITGDVLRHHAIPIPPPGEDDTIAARVDALFAEVDDGEAALARARDDLATWRKALLKAAVTGELTAEWRAANPPTESGTDLLARILADRRVRWESDPRNRGKQYKDPLEADRDTLPAVPEEWTWATAEQVIRKAEYGTSIKCHEAPSGPPVLRMGNIQDGGLDWRKLKYAPQDASLPMLEAGDVLFNRTNSAELLGKSAVFDGSDSPVSFASYIVAVRLAGVLPHFFSAWMNSIYGRQWIAQNKSQQVGQANLSAGTLMRMEIPVPPIVEQQRIVEHIAADRARDDALGNDLDDLAEAGATLRQSILAAAFRGDLA